MMSSFVASTSRAPAPSSRAPASSSRTPPSTSPSGGGGGWKPLWHAWSVGSLAPVVEVHTSSCGNGGSREHSVMGGGPPPGL
jgi:hypothetical protein